MATTLAPAPQRQAAPARVVRHPLRRVGRLAKTTPGRLSLIALVLILISLLAGGLTAWSVQRRAAALQDLATRSEPLSIAAQEVYRSLSDADATAASAFLSGGLEPAALHQRYQSDIAQAESALSLAAGEATQSSEFSGALATLSGQLPVYTGLVETARTNNRRGEPVGAAYLREASGLMRSQLLPAAQELYRAETAHVVRDQNRAGTPPVVEVLLGLAALAVLVFAQRYLIRRTKRIFNIGLVLATTASVISLVWVVTATSVAIADVSASRSGGSTQVDVLARARIATLTARGDETLTLVTRGSGQAYEEHYAEVSSQLGGPDGSGGLLGSAKSVASTPAVRQAVDAAIADFRAWQDLHKKVRDADDAGDYNGAVALTVGTDTDSTAKAFDRLDADLVTAIKQATQSFAGDVAAARSALTGLAPGVVLLALLSAVASTTGLWQRLKEYR